MPILYKYRTVSEYTDDIIMRNALYFSNPKDFNDPFDSRIPISFDTDDETLRTQLIKLLQQQMPHLSCAQVTSHVDNSFKSGKAQYYKSEAFAQKMMNSLLDTMSICSFSAKRDDILMWSHYANNHKGICLEFDVSEENGMGGAKPVTYADDYPKINFYTNTSKEAENAVIFHKALKWAYEEEWRIVQPYRGTNFYGFKEEALIGIIFGLACIDETKEHYKQLLKGRKQPVKVYQARRKRNELSLQIDEVETLV